MSERQPERTGALLAGGAGIVLIASMFLEWYTLELPERVRRPEVELPSLDAFEALERADVAVVVAAGLAIIIAGIVLARVVASSLALGIALTAVGLLGLAVVIYRGIISPPGFVLFRVDLETQVGFGWFVAVAAAALIVVGGLLTCLAGPRARPTILTPRDG
jgi:hypothetical protein